MPPASVRFLSVTPVTVNGPYLTRTGLVLPVTGLGRDVALRWTGLGRGKRDGPRTVTGPRLTATVQTVIGLPIGTVPMTVIGLGAVPTVTAGTVRIAGPIARAHLTVTACGHPPATGLRCVTVPVLRGERNRGSTLGLHRPRLQEILLGGFRRFRNPVRPGTRMRFLPLRFPLVLTVTGMTLRRVR